MPELAEFYFTLGDGDNARTFEWDWSRWLTALGDTISSYTIPDVTGLTIDQKAESAGVVSARIQIDTSFSDGDEIDVVCEVVTAGGETDSRILRLKVIDR